MASSIFPGKFPCQTKRWTGTQPCKPCLDYPPLLGPMTSSFSLDAQPTVQDTDRCSACSCVVVVRKNKAGSLVGGIVYRSGRAKGVGEHQHGGNKWKEGQLCSHAVSYYGYSVCRSWSAHPGSRAVSKGLAAPHPTCPWPFTCFLLLHWSCT